ncbi:glutathione S-transferase 3, mitochondrial-like [Zophobas morio]|uniref:glutathione S-transferase 3, mitochondrial-like n=1 Tax=Zophobas morio TaxID=2755281 RepID=UPI00308333AE
METVLRPGHGYVIISGIFSALIPLWAGFNVSRARKEYNIDYPQMYADSNDENGKKFNCIQRAHQNVVENISTHYLLLLFSAIFRPEYAAICALIRNLGFITFVCGYSSGDPSKRKQGCFGYLGLLGMLGLSIEAACRLLNRCKAK